MLGVTKGVGTTHFTIKAGIYFSEVLRNSVAVVELLTQGTFDKFEVSCFGKKIGEKAFEVLGITYYKNTTVAELVAIINSSFDTIVIDMGSNYNAVRLEFLRCNQKIVIGALSEWKIEDFNTFVQWASMQPGSIEWGYYYIFGTYLLEKDYCAKLHIPLQQIPFSKDPFTIEKEEFRFLNAILKY